LKKIAEEWAPLSKEMASKKNSDQQNLSGNLQVIIACCFAKIVLELPDILSEGRSPA
jgi:hypothetical protein